MFDWFKKKKEEVVEVKTKTENVRDLLRENLNTVRVDVFYKDDPLIGLNDGERIEYLKHFDTLSRDELLMDRIKYLINTQALLTIQNIKEKDGSWDTAAGAMNINGLGLIKDDIEKLATIFKKEQAEAHNPEFNPHEGV